MKKLLILIVLSPFLTLHSQLTFWENISNQIPGDSTNSLSDVCVPDRWSGFISSKSKPEIYRGDFWTGTWDVLQTPSPVNSFYMLDYDWGIICGADSNVYQTTDAGESWVNFGTLGKPLNDIDIHYYYEGSYVCGDDGAVGFVTDTGLIDISSGLNIDFVSISSPFKDSVWLCGDSLIYYYNGITFNEIFAGQYSLNSIFFINELYGWVVGDSGFIAYTSDGGNNWIQKQNPDTIRRDLNDIYDFGSLSLVVGDDGLILETTDGDNWVIVSDNSQSNDLVSIYINYGAEFGPGLAVGTNKTALIWPIIVSVDGEPKAVDNFYLSQNYPNPFNPTTKIKYNIPTITLRQAQNDIIVSLKVYDVLGREVATLVNEEQNIGEHEVEFNASQMSSGIYFYQLIAGGFVETKKMILMK